MTARHWIERLVVLATILTVACGGDGPTPPPSPGAIRVDVTTTGFDLDEDGYRVLVRGADRGAVGGNATLVIGDLATGDYSVSLGGLVSNCGVTEEHPRTVAVAAGDTTEVSFGVLCTTHPRGTGSIVVSLSATGNDASDQFDLAIDGQYRQLVGAGVRTVTVPGVPVGDRFVTLSGLAPNCTLPSSTQLVRVTEGAVTTVEFTATCRWLSPAPYGRILHRRRAPGEAERLGMLSLAFGEGAKILFEAPAAGLQIHDPVWSDDRTRLAFRLVDPSTSASRVYVLNADGTTLATLEPADIIGQAAFSPDGTRLIYGTTSGAIRTIALGGGSPSTIFTADAPVQDPSYSFDGTRILFAAGGTIRVVNADGTGELRLTSASETSTSPTWSPSGGDKILYLSDAGGGSRLWTMHGDGSQPRAITPQDMAVTEGGTWSFDESAVVFAAGGDLWQLNALSPDAHRLTNTPGVTESAPDWVR